MRSGPLVTEWDIIRFESYDIHSLDVLKSSMSIDIRYRTYHHPHGSLVTDSE